MFYFQIAYGILKHVQLLHLVQLKVYLLHHGQHLQKLHAVNDLQAYFRILAVVKFYQLKYPLVQPMFQRGQYQMDLDLHFFQLYL